MPVLGDGSGWIECGKSADEDKIEDRKKQKAAREV
jgi:hypothetical protein